MIKNLKKKKSKSQMLQLNNSQIYNLVKLHKNEFYLIKKKVTNPSIYAYIIS